MTALDYVMWFEEIKSHRREYWLNRSKAGGRVASKWKTAVGNAAAGGKWKEKANVEVRSRQVR